jgi:PPM family protein phosphatase
VSIGWAAAARTHRGRVRRRNEDAFAVDLPRGIFAVADGMGGHAAGQVASTLAVEHAHGVLGQAHDDGGDLAPEQLHASFVAARRALVEHVSASPADRGLGTTLTVLALNPGGVFRVGHLGDSRLYRFRAGGLERLTSDHTLVRREVAAGRLPESALAGHPLSHILSRVLADDGEDDPDLMAGSPAPGDLFLLCSDGLHGVVTDEEMARMAREEPEPDRWVAELVRAALAAGAPDNVTAVAVRILPAGG